MSSGSRSLLLVTGVVFAGSVVFPAQTAEQRAWQILEAGVQDKNADVRALAVAPLGLLPRNPRAGTLAEKAMEDERPEVRAAGARALGLMLYAPSIPKLRTALTDKEESVVLAAAHSLVQLKDPAGYDLYYAVLTGQRRKGERLIKQQPEVLKDKKKVAEYSLEEGIGFLPFGGYGVSAVEFVKSVEQDASSSKAVAAKFLAEDPDPQAGKALVGALAHKNWLVREAALEAIANRGDPALLDEVESVMSDGKDRLRYTAAATVIRLTNVEASKK